MDEYKMLQDGRELRCVAAIMQMQMETGNILFNDFHMSYDTWHFAYGSLQ
jgi:hypothetical protein